LNFTAGQLLPYVVTTLFSRHDVDQPDARKFLRHDSPCSSWRNSPHLARQRSKSSTHRLSGIKRRWRQS